MFRADPSPFAVADESQAGAEGEPRTELQRLQAKWYKALEEGYQSRLLKVFKLKQDARERLFYVLKQDSNVEPLKTTVRARTIRDDLAVYDAQVTYTNIPHVGVKQDATFKLVPDPKAVGVDPLEVVKLVNRTIRGST